MRVKVTNAPGFEDEFEATLIAHARSVDGRPVTVVEFDERDENGHTQWSGVPSEYVRELRGEGVYAECGCIYPCPDHLTAGQTAKDDRAYWTDRYDREENDDAGE